MWFTSASVSILSKLLLTRNSSMAFSVRGTNSVKIILMHVLSQSILWRAFNSLFQYIGSNNQCQPVRTAVAATYLPHTSCARLAFPYWTHVHHFGASSQCKTPSSAESMKSTVSPFFALTHVGTKLHDCLRWMSSKHFALPRYTDVFFFEKSDLFNVHVCSIISWHQQAIDSKSKQSFWFLREMKWSTFPAQTSDTHQVDLS